MSIVRIRRRLSAGERSSAGVPVRNATARFGAASERFASAGRKRRKSSALSRSNGRCRGRFSIAASSAGGPPEIASLSGSETDAQAVKVESSATHSAACVEATGATSEAACSKAGNRRAKPVSGEERLRSAGSASRTSGSSPARKRLRSCPRPAKPAP